MLQGTVKDDKGLLGHGRVHEGMHPSQRPQPLLQVFPALQTSPVSAVKPHINTCDILLRPATMYIAQHACVEPVILNTAAFHM